MYQNFFKPLIDFFAALLGLVLLSPIFLLVSLILWFVNKGSPFFIQKRPGKNEKIFGLIKFKTMRDLPSPEESTDTDAKRLTKIGIFIRKISLDELPQLINVLKGDMSMIGPRPLFVRYLPLYNEFQKRRHEVKPGITGWAQINGRNTSSWKGKFENDVWYVDHISFLLDCRIMVLTIKKVLLREGIAQEGQATTELFKGND